MEHQVQRRRPVPRPAWCASGMSLRPTPPPCRPNSSPTCFGSLAAAPGLAAQLSRKVRRGKSSKHVLREHVVVPETLFALGEKPACAFEGHGDDVLDMSWSRESSRLLSSSMDNPADDGYFISGSLDWKVRIWSVADRQAGRLSSSVHGSSRRSDDDASDGGASVPLRPKSGSMTYMGGQAEMLRKDASSRECGGNAWGMVVVTASLDGEIRVYQNFVMPLGIRGQSNRFH